MPDTPKTFAEILADSRKKEGTPKTGSNHSSRTPSKPYTHGTSGRTDAYGESLYTGRPDETTVTGVNPANIYKSKQDYLKAVQAKGINTQGLSDEQIQQAIYDKADPFQKAYLWGRAGNTNKGINKLKQPKTFPQWGLTNSDESFKDYKARLIKSGHTPETLNKDLEPYRESFADNNLGLRSAGLVSTIGQEETPQEKITTQQTPGSESAKTTITNTPIITKAEHLGYPPPPQETPWWIQDIIKTGNAAANYMGVKKYNPWQASEAVFTPEVTFKDPTRELAANSERLNIGANTMAQFTGPQAFNARFNQMSGQSAGTAADILGRYNNDNIQISNGQSAQNAAIMNDYAQRKAFGNTSLYDKYTIANQQFDNSRSQARDVLVNQFVQGITNKNYTANLNKMNPQFAVDPLAGGEYYFRNPREMDGKFNPQKSVDQIYEDMLTSHATFQNTPEGQKRAWEAAKIKAGIKDQNAFDNYNPNQGIVPNQYPGG